MSLWTKKSLWHLAYLGMTLPFVAPAIAQTSDNAASGAAQAPEASVEQKSAPAPAPKPMSSKKPTATRKGKVVRLSGKLLRLNTSRFIDDIAPGQNFVVKEKKTGVAAAVIAIVKLSKSKKTAVAKVVEFKSVQQLSGLVGLEFFKETDLKELTPSASAQGDGPTAESPARNSFALLALRFGTRQSISTNIVTGTEINQDLNVVAARIDAFPPYSLSAIANRFGLSVLYETALPVTLVAGAVTSAANQTMTIRETVLEPSLVFRHNYSQASLARYSLSAGYRMSTSEFTFESDSGTGNTKVELKHTGPVVGLEADFSPLPYFYLGLSTTFGIPQAYAATDSGTNANLKGAWNVYAALFFGELRYLLGQSRSQMLCLNFSAGVASHQAEVNLGEVKTSKSYLSPEVRVSVGYGAG